MNGTAIVPAAVYLVETWSKPAGWQVVGWFRAFDYAMSVATSLPVARVSLVDLDSETTRKREPRLRGPAPRGPAPAS